MATKVERWVAMDGSEFETAKAADEYDFIETAVTRFMEPETRHHGAGLLRKMIAAGYGFITPDAPKAAAR